MNDNKLTTVPIIIIAFAILMILDALFRAYNQYRHGDPPHDLSNAVSLAMLLFFSLVRFTNSKKIKKALLFLAFISGITMVVVACIPDKKDETTYKNKVP